MNKLLIQCSAFLLLFLCSENHAYGQSLQFSTCEYLTFAVNDHSDVDEDGEDCEAMILLTKTANYVNNESCDLSPINWIVVVDLDSDGVQDLEYSSDLPIDDDDLDDTNGNGIPDKYLAPTLNNQVQQIALPDIVGPQSNHSVIWKVLDACDNGALCVNGFEIVDQKPPTPFCVSISTVLLNNFDIYISAEDFGVGVYDNCTPSNEIKASFSPDSIVPHRLISCDDFFNSPIDLLVYFFDDSGNSQLCTVYLQVVIDDNIDCYETFKIAGDIRTNAGVAIPNAVVTLSAALPEFPLTAFTDENGHYSFGQFEPSILPFIKMDVKKEDSYYSKVSTLDLVLIVLHILGTKSFTNPYQAISADINGDHEIKASDLSQLRKLILGIITELPGNLSWIFVPEHLEFEDPSNPWSELESLESYDFSQMESGKVNFIGVKIGDVSGQ